ncbi:MAG: PH domain-containing protein [Actinomycetota bacterium]
MARASRTFRNDEVRRMAWLFAIGITAIVLLGPLLSDNASWSGVVPFLAIALLVAWRLGRVKVVTSQAGVQVVNPVKTHWVPWDQVVRFRKGEGEFWRREEQAYLEARDTTISLVAIQSMNRLSRSSRARPDETIEELNQMMRSYRSGAEVAEERSVITKSREQLRRLVGVLAPPILAGVYLLIGRQGEGMMLIKTSVVVVCLVIAAANLANYLRSRDGG